MSGFDRADRSVLARWWWTVDRWTLAALMLLAAVGAILIMAASPSVAERIGVAPFHFIERQFVFLPLSLGVLLITSLASPVTVRRVALACLAIVLGLLVLTPLVGTEIKGATRWIAIGGLSIQASEFVKPCFAVTAAWLFASQRGNPSFPGNLLSAGLYLAIVALLVLQPDVGMVATVTAVWGTQFFLAGLRMVWVALLATIAVAGLIAGYYTMSHVQDRIDQFLDPTTGDTYQADTAIMAFEQGGLFGRGPGQGVVKDILPDAHADYIFAVAAEEFGLIACLGIIALFAFVTLRGFVFAYAEKRLFALLAVTGLSVQFGIQAIINMAVNLRLMPAKGMTLPFISYGGSSLIALALGMGFLLALTRRNAEQGAGA
ncbi:MAG: cell division protein FtsW [Alphaproteobacteria bacterium]|nr:cell division protein FtsW [Alphaproteobacteria bacterium]